MPPTLKMLGGHITLYLSVQLSIGHAFETFHTFGTMNARILHFHICIAYEKLADLYF